jgi:hypothetical protein
MIAAVKREQFPTQCYGRMEEARRVAAYYEGIEGEV